MRDDPDYRAYVKAVGDRRAPLTAEQLDGIGRVMRPAFADLNTPTKQKRVVIKRAGSSTENGGQVA